MNNETIGYKPNSVVLPEMPKPRSIESTGIKFVSLNSTDQRLSNMSDAEFDKIAQKMAAKNISGLDLDSNL